MTRFPNDCGSTPTRRAARHRSRTSGWALGLIAVLGTFGTATAVARLEIAPEFTAGQLTTLTGVDLTAECSTEFAIGVRRVVKQPRLVTLADLGFIDGSLSTAQCDLGPDTHQYRAVPEPQTWLVAFSGLGTLLALQRFRRGRTHIRRT